MQREKQKKIKNENKNKTVASNLNYNFLFKSFFHPSFQEGRKALGAKPIIRTPKSLIFFSIISSGEIAFRMKDIFKFK